MATINHHKKSYHRDNSILSEIEKCGALDTEQITQLFFKTQTQGQRIAQRRLAKLVKDGRLHRDRLSLYTPYFYYINKKPKLVEHTLATNWAYVWIKNKLSYNEEILCFTTEEKYGIIRPDAFVGLLNNKQKINYFYFIEVDLSNNMFDKVKKYNQLYKERGYIDKWWSGLSTGFPSIVIFTHRVSQVKYRIATENENNLDFQVYDIKDIRIGRLNK